MGRLETRRSRMILVLVDRIASSHYLRVLVSERGDSQLRQESLYVHPMVVEYQIKCTVASTEYFHAGRTLPLSTSLSMQRAHPTF